MYNAISAPSGNCEIRSNAVKNQSIRNPRNHFTITKTAVSNVVLGDGSVI